MDVVDAENSYVESFRFKQISGNDSKADSAKIQFRKSMGALASPMPASSSPLKDLSQLALLTNQFKFDGLDPSKELVVFQESDRKTVEWFGIGSNEKAYRLLTPAECFDDDKENSFFAEILYSGHEKSKCIAIIANEASTDISVVAYSDDGHWCNWELEEGCGIVLPFDEDGNDTFPTGMALDFTNTEGLPGLTPDSPTLPPCPILHIKTNTGAILSFYCILSSVGEDDVYYKKVGQKKQAQQAGPITPKPAAAATNGFSFLKSNAATTNSSPFAKPFGSRAAVSDQSPFSVVASSDKANPFAAPKSRTSTAPSGFSFSNAASTEKPAASSSFSFAPKSATTDGSLKEEKAQPAATGFSFSKASTASSSEKPDAASPFPFAAAATKSETTKEDKPAQPAATGFSFSKASTASSSEKPATASPFSFAATAAKSETTKEDKPAQPEATGFSFAKASTASSSEKPATASPFSFAAAATKPESTKEDKPAQPEATGFSFAKASTASSSEMPATASPFLSATKPSTTVADPVIVKDERKPLAPTKITQIPAKTEINIGNKNQVLVDKFDEYYNALQDDFASLANFIDTFKSDITSSSILSDLPKTRLHAEHLRSSISTVKDQLLDISNTKVEQSHALSQSKAKMDECVKRIEYLQGGNSSLKSELSHRKISPESEVLQEALMLKKNAIEADIELATDVSEKILSGKARKTNHSLLTIANTTNQIRRSISALDKDLDIAANALSCIQIASGLQDKSGSKKSSSKKSIRGETGKSKRGPFGLVGDDIFADDSAFKAPIVGIGNTRHSNLRKARQVAMQKQSLRLLEVVVPSINRKPALEPVAFPQILKASVNLAEAENDDDGEESIFDEEDEEYSIIDNDESTPGPESGDQSFIDEKYVGNQSFEGPCAIASTSAASQSFFALATKPLEGVGLINSAKKESLPDPVSEKSFSFGFGSATNSPAPASILHAKSSSPAPSSGALTSSFPSKQKDLFSYTLPDTSKAASPVSHSLLGVPRSSSKETGKQQPPGFSFPVTKDSPANPFAQSSLPSSTSRPFSFSNAVKKETDAAAMMPAPTAPVALSFVAPVRKEEVVKPMFSFAQPATSLTASAESVSTHATKDTKESSKEAPMPSLFSFDPSSLAKESASSSSFSGGLVEKKVEVINEVSPQKPTSLAKVTSTVKSASPVKSPSPIKAPSPAAPSPVKSVAKDPPSEEIESDQEIENTFARQGPVAGLGNADEDEGTAGTTAEISEVRDDEQREETFESSQIVDDAEQSGLNVIEEKPSFQIDASFAAGLSALLPEDDQIVVTPEKKASSAIEADLPTASTAKDLDAMDDDDELIIDDNKPAEKMTAGTTSTSGFGGGLGGFSTQPKNTINPMFSIPASSAPSAAASKTSFSSFSSGVGGGSVFGQSAFGSTAAAPSNNPFATSALSAATAPSNSFGSSSQQPQKSGFFGSQQPAQPSVFGSPAAAPLSQFGSSSAFSNTAATTPSPFGASKQGTSVFGSVEKPPQPNFGQSSFASTAPATSAFGQSSFRATGFGSQQPQSTPAFGGVKPVSAFSSGAATSTGGGFGQSAFSSQQPQASPSVFGSVGFGQPASLAANSSFSAVPTNASAFSSFASQPVASFGSLAQQGPATNAVFGSGNSFGNSAQPSSSAYKPPNKTSFTQFR